MEHIPLHSILLAIDQCIFQEVVLTSEQDSFFRANMYENFGDIGMNIKRMVDEFHQIEKSNQKIQTIGRHEANRKILV